VIEDKERAFGKAGCGGRRAWQACMAEAAGDAGQDRGLCCGPPEAGGRVAELAAPRVRRETEENGEGAPWKEQETWEGEQIKKASMRVGAQDRAAAAAAYDFVIDDQIEFIKDQALAGDLVRLRPALPYHIP